MAEELWSIVRDLTRYIKKEEAQRAAEGKKCADCFSFLEYATGMAVQALDSALRRGWDKAKLETGHLREEVDKLYAHGCLSAAGRGIVEGHIRSFEAFLDEEKVSTTSLIEAVARLHREVRDKVCRYEGPRARELK